MQIEVIGLNGVKKSLGELSKKTNDVRPLLEELTNHIKNAVEESFQNQASPDGIKWSPIKKGTHKNYRLGTDKILYKNGDMQKSLTPKVYDTYGTVGVNAISEGGYQYPLVHQFGTTKAGRKNNITIVARPFMPIKSDGSLYEKTERELEEIVADYFRIAEGS
ncbi:MAG: phage virion morphogenesis protein [Campylobacterales bacterium]|nr:phage virion morphogenesis protein [Campylobacterales bacterium]